MIITVKGGLIMDIMSNIEIDVLTIDYDAPEEEVLNTLLIDVSSHPMFSIKKRAFCLKWFPDINPEETMKVYDYIENKLNI